ncbi:CDP-diacylglycerol--serine O-phosphatidyltransferase [Paenibacillus sp. 19GGS1-52]|uniref:CDP-diacylglycerol--serine O-phosphatidyltransferase n=1 Tax=Paenibacillus sp. 19GGS1-52 TaxID=2758563 RepID=UPI001EFAFD7C|nr:CDP-diacylglycerol--serine O-phosphatidyltransferase [Paenibacillus sp. 19GGS1-52]ULO08064.1 CDP-diacylglycerol--serine O-phosphatidyltransferase [Paenibacillus sp. 19GGS1-52]
MIQKSIPSLFTIGNLMLGMFGIMMAFDGKLNMAAIMVIIAMLLDGLDGRVARALKCESEFGKELDSLSDVVSFGVAPALIMYVTSLHDLNSALGMTVTAIFPVFGALRLARFNVRPGIPGYFVGLPIPAAGGVLATLALFHKDVSAPFMIIATLLLSYLMVSTVKYPNFKKIGLPKKAVIGAPVVIVVAVALAVVFPEQIAKLIFALLALYALYGFKQNIDRLTARRRHRRRRRSEEKIYHSKNG